MNNNICIIPARGGSKRIPKKNIKDFCGKPMIAWSIEAALQSQLFDEVIVSSDSEEIIAIAKQYGASAPFIRPKQLADDYTGTTPVVNHCINWLQEQGKLIDKVCCLYATAPFVTPAYLQKGAQNLDQANCHTSFSVTSYPFPIQRAIVLNGKGVQPFLQGFMDKRSQDLQETYHDAGQFYWGRPKAFLENKDMFADTSFPVILPRYLVQDIDTEEDWIIAEGLKKLQLSQ